MKKRGVIEGTLSAVLWIILLVAALFAVTFLLRRLLV